jgi:hypothetical protein
MSSEQLHASRERLSKDTLATHQAIVSLMEELGAADWYRQRADDCDDRKLKEILLHNMSEEIEHASAPRVQRPEGGGCRTGAGAAAA